MKKILWPLLTVGVFLALSVGQVMAREPTNIYFFYSQSCPHCKTEKPLLEFWADKYNDLTLYELEISEPEAAQLMARFGEKLEADTSGVPFTVMGGKYLSGWSETYTREFETYLKQCLEEGCEDPFAESLPAWIDEYRYQSAEGGGRETTPEEVSLTPAVEERENTPEEKRIGSAAEDLELPVFGKLRVGEVSLPLLTVMVAAVDGFNPCAMWVLLFLISLLLNVPSKPKRFVLGSAFILASGAVYFGFLAAWLNFFLFVGMVVWLRWLIGSVAVGFGGWNIFKSLTDQSGCIVEGGERRKHIFERLRALVVERNFALAVVGIMGLAIAVNLVELVCSAGLPAVYTSVLSLSDLPSWQYYLYLLLYVLVFMLDDMIVFSLAMATMHAVGVESKYARYTKLLGGAILALLGLGLIFKPEWVMLG